MTMILFVLGLVLLIVGAELLVRGAIRLAMGIGISPLVVGLTVVALGTSSPELAVTIQSAFSGQSDMAMGNVVGSNITNILLILGLSALITPLVVVRQMVRLDVPVMIGSSFLLLVLGWDGAISRGDGAILFTTIILYTTYLITLSRQEQKTNSESIDEAGERHLTSKQWGVNSLMVIGGLALLTFGARWMVDSAVIFARYLGISELIIGLTIVSAGTSLPEIVTSIVASIRGERELAVGNVIGSNIFNILCILGLAALVSPASIAVSSVVLRFDIPVMIAIALLCLPIFFNGYTIFRWEGALLLSYYFIYTIYLVLGAIQSTMLPAFGLLLTWIIIPLTLITLLIVTVRNQQQLGQSAQSPL